MKITILTHLENEEAREHDVVVDQVAAALRELGHQPSILGVHADLGKLLRGIKRCRSGRYSSKEASASSCATPLALLARSNSRRNS
jgi:hypothetical protein